MLSLKSVMWTLLVIGLLGLILGVSQDQEEAECGQAGLDNDLQDDLEVYCADPTMESGAVGTVDEDADGDFDRIFVGTKGGGRIFGWADFDGRPEEDELVISDPTLVSGSIRSVDADSDGDTEVIWVGVQGLDMDRDGTIEPEENGLIAGFADIDGDEDLEIVVADTSRALGDYLAAAFGLDKEKADGFEVVWVGLLNNNQRTRAGSIVALFDDDSDGDDEVLVQDFRRKTQQDYIDIDNDDDPDIIIGEF